MTGTVDSRLRAAIALGLVAYATAVSLAAETRVVGVAADGTTFHVWVHGTNSMWHISSSGRRLISEEALYLRKSCHIVLLGHDGKLVVQKADSRPNERRTVALDEGRIAEVYQISGGGLLALIIHPKRESTWFRIDPSNGRATRATQRDFSRVIFHKRPPYDLQIPSSISADAMVFSCAGLELRFSGRDLQRALGDWYDHPVVSKARTPILRYAFADGGLFGLSPHQERTGYAYKVGYLTWQSKTRHWERLELEVWSGRDRLLGDHVAVFQEARCVSGARGLGGNEPVVIPTGTWHFFDFRTGNLSSIHLDAGSEMLDMNAKDEVLARNGDELYVARMVDGRMLQPETKREWKEYWRFVVKDPRVKEMKWVFLLDEETPR